MYENYHDEKVTGKRGNQSDINLFQNYFYKMDKHNMQCHLRDPDFSINSQSDVQIYYLILLLYYTAGF